MMTKQAKCFRAVLRMTGTAALLIVAAGCVSQSSSSSSLPSPPASSSGPGGDTTADAGSQGKQQQGGSSGEGDDMADLPELPQGHGGSGTARGESAGEPASAPADPETNDIPTTLPPRNTTPGDYRPVQVARVPADIPSGDDDDVLARQLREAATNEQDPKLRDKLWAEYREYKNATQ